MVVKAKQLPYHHGSLRNALVQAALELVEQKDPATLTLKELAVAAGVSQAAPYRHFQDRSAALRAVAAEGFRDMIKLNKMHFKSEGPALERMRRSAKAFLAFARQRPGLFQLMYSPPIDTLAGDPEIRDLCDELNRDLTEMLRECQPGADERSLHLQMLAQWAILFGHAMSSLKHPMQPRATLNLNPEDVEEAVIDAAISLLARPSP